MTKIKICGLFRENDIDFVNEALPDFIGFVFAKSRRQIVPETAKKFKQNLNKNIYSVGVFVNEPVKNIAEICDKNIIDLIQLHGNEDEKYIKSLRTVCNNKIIKAVTVKNAADILRSRNCTADYLLLDNGCGSGERFDWELLKTFVKPYFLAGGINKTNIDEALSLKPYCIDISSGVETENVKDKQKILDIVRRVKNG